MLGHLIVDIPPNVIFGVCLKSSKSSSDKRKSCLVSSSHWCSLCHFYHFVRLRMLQPKKLISTCTCIIQNWEESVISELIHQRTNWTKTATTTVEEPLRRSRSPKIWASPPLFGFFLPTASNDRWSDRFARSWQQQQQQQQRQHRRPPTLSFARHNPDWQDLFFPSSIFSHPFPLSSISFFPIILIIQTSSEKNPNQSPWLERKKEAKTNQVIFSKSANFVKTCGTNLSTDWLKTRWVEFKRKGPTSWQKFLTFR